MNAITQQLRADVESTLEQTDFVSGWTHYTAADMAYDETDYVVNGLDLVGPEHTILVVSYDRDAVDAESYIEFIDDTMLNLDASLIDSDQGSTLHGVDPTAVFAVEY